MPLLEVPCPGCQAVLKAPDTMAGKKARCKRCNTPFRIPGAPAADSVGDSQQLSAVVPPPAPRKAAAAPPPPPEDDIPAATAVDDDEPFSASVAEDDPLPAVVSEEPPTDPFAFSAAPAKKGRKPRDEDPPEPPPPAADPSDPFSFSPAAPESKKARKPRDEAEDDERPAARKKPAGGGGGGGGGLIKVAVAAAVFALVAGGVVAGVLIYLANNKPGEQAKNDKKDEKKLDPPSNEPTPAPPSPTEPTTKDKDATKANKGTTPGGNKATKGPKAGGGTMLSLGQAKALALPPKPAAPKMVTEPASNPVPLTVPFAEVRRLFAPGKAEGDVGVAWKSAAGFQGAGEKITLSLFSPTSGTETAKVEADSDGLPDPACDLSADGGTFVFGNRTSGKVTVWDVRKKSKKLDAFDPYKDKPEHKAAKLAAVYLTEPPDKLITVTTAGAVHVWDVATKAEAGEYVPPKAAAGKVTAGRGAAAMTNRQGVVVAVGGVVHAVTAVGGVNGTQVADLGGDVGKSLALAMSPSGRVVYAFETDDNGKKEKAVVDLSEGKLGKVLRWPAEAGEPVAAGWVGDAVAAVATSQGAVVWFDGDGGGFNPLGVARTPEDKGLHAAGDYHWSLLPAAGDAKRCVAVSLALPPAGVGDPLTPAARRPVASLVLDLKGLSQ